MNYNKGRLFVKKRSIKATKKYKGQKFAINGIENYHNGYGWITKTFFGKVK